MSSLMKRAQQANGRLILAVWQELLGAQEKYVGFYMGCMAAYSLYFLACIVSYVSDSKVLHGDDVIRHDSTLFIVVCVCYMSAQLFWVAIVWIWPDPGMVDTRDHDFEEVCALYKLIEIMCIGDAV